MNAPNENPATLMDALEALKQLGADRFKEFRSLVRDLSRHMSHRDMMTLFFAPLLGASMLKGVVGGKALKDDRCNPDDFDEDMLQSVLQLARWLSQHYFSTAIHHIDLLPADRPALIVGNHSAGLMPMDALFAIDAIRENQGPERRVYSLAHDFAYMSPRVGRLARSIGVIRAKKENALRALELGHHVLVYPGGDQEAFRSFQDRKKIVLAGRRGFVRLAMNAGVPIVPMVSVGLHESFFVIYRGENLARTLGLKQLIRSEILPFAFSIPWGFAPAFFPFIPLPTAIEIEFCPPIIPVGSPDDDDAVQSVFNEVETAMQTTMDRLYENRLPILGR